MKRIVLASAVLVLAGVAQAQEIKDGQWRGLAGMSASLSAGNTDSRNFVANANVARSTADDKWAIYGNALSGYSKIAGVSTSNNRWLAGTQYDRNLNKDLYAFGTGEISGDRSLALTFRGMVGAGVGYHVIATPLNTFNVFAGADYRHDNYSQPQVIGGTSRSSYGAPELMVGEESSHKLTDSVTFQQKLVAFPNLRDTNQFRATFDAGLAVAMNKTMNLTVGMTDRYNSQVASGFKKNDLTAMMGVSMKLGN